MDGYPDAAMVVEIRYDEDKYVGFLLKHSTTVKPAVHGSYLLSKNSLVTIGVSKFPRVWRRFESFC